jgi:hypothetical protein
MAPDPEAGPPELEEHGAPPSDIDAQGVDRAQIRRMLALSPLERVRWLDAIVGDVLELRRLNEKRPVRRDPAPSR